MKSEKNIKYVFSHTVCDVIAQLTLYNVIDTRRAVYMVHEFAMKGNIANNIPFGGLLDESYCRRLMTGIITGVQFIHKHNIVHR